ncbi:unnamed protein product [Prorocentrum cordatum]|uniref:C3H1-type domain-containing protein n=1 Tax=Prorocentrum cordatum TaxID=2364126 RepID=A0ABN9UNZ2_9DINO|nr:unnamed protein product [Polarella glacialis]
MPPVPGHFCRAFQAGLCQRGGDCPLMHQLPAGDSSTTADASYRPSASSGLSDAGQLEGQDSQDNESSWSWSWTSSGASSESRSWADLSEELWGTAPATAARANGTWPSQPPGAGGKPSGWAPSAPSAAARPVPPGPDDGFPSFSDRNPNIPEFIPSEAASLGGAASAQPRVPKSKSAARRKQRMVMEKWVVMKAKNGATAAEMVEAACIALSRPQAQTSHEPRTESASPPRPLVPPTSPRKQRRSREDGNDSDDSGDDRGERAFVNTKVSL